MCMMIHWKIKLHKCRNPQFYIAIRECVPPQRVCPFTSRSKQRVRLSLWPNEPSFRVDMEDLISQQMLVQRGWLLRGTEPLAVTDDVSLTPSAVRAVPTGLSTLSECQRWGPGDRIRDFLWRNSPSSIRHISAFLTFWLLWEFTFCEVWWRRNKIARKREGIERLICRLFRAVGLIRMWFALYICLHTNAIL